MSRDAWDHVGKIEEYLRHDEKHGAVAYLESVLSAVAKTPATEGSSGNGSERSDEAIAREVYQAMWSCDPDKAARIIGELRKTAVGHSADSDAFVEDIVKWIQNKIQACESAAWKAAWQGNYATSASMDVRKQAYMCLVAEIQDLQKRNLTAESGDAASSTENASSTAPTPDYGSLGFEIGDLIEAIPPYRLVCGSSIYRQAVLVSVKPFVAVSARGDMLWRATIAPEKVRRIGKALPEVLSIAMRRFQSGN